MRVFFEGADEQCARYQACRFYIFINAGHGSAVPASADTGQAGQRVIRRRVVAQKRPYADDELGREPCNVRKRLLGADVGRTSGITKYGRHERLLGQIKSFRKLCFTDGVTLVVFECRVL